jgi:hypothetical protein
MKNLVIVVVLILAGFGAWYYFTATQPVEPELAVEAPSPVRTTVPETAPPTVMEAEEPEVVLQPEPGFEAVTQPRVEEIPLPMLEDSDAVVLDSLGGLIGIPAVGRYVVSDNVISRIVATIDTLGSRQIPAVVQVVEGPQSMFVATANDQPEETIRNEEGDEIPQFVIDPANFDRYTPYVEMLEGVDVNELVGLYRSHYPLFRQAYQQMGYGDGDFSGRLAEIIDELLATPVVDRPVELMKPEAYFLFTDPGLEARPAGQKILLRMGNENAARVKVKLLEIRQAL